MAECRHDAVRDCVYDEASSAAYGPAPFGDDELRRGAVSTASRQSGDRTPQTTRRRCSVGGRRMGMAGKALGLAARRLGRAAAWRLFRALDRVPARQRSTPLCAGGLARVGRRAASKSCRTGGRSERIGGRGNKRCSKCGARGFIGCSSLVGCSSFVGRSGLVGRSVTPRYSPG